MKIVNLTHDELRKDLNEIWVSLTHNEESRLAFSRKSLVSSIRILEDFTAFYDSAIEKKI